MERVASLGYGIILWRRHQVPAASGELPAMPCATGGRDHYRVLTYLKAS